MSSQRTHEEAPRKPIRFWPGAAAGVLTALAWLGLPLAAPSQSGTAVLAGAVGALAILLWWLLFSRARWRERLGALVLMAVALLTTAQVVHPSIANGMMGLMPFLYGVPLLSLALVAAVAVTLQRPAGSRQVVMLAAILLACGLMTLVRTDGVRGDGGSDFRWRWTPTAEERLLARGEEPPPAGTAPPAVASPGREEAADDAVLTAAAAGVEVPAPSGTAEPVDAPRREAHESAPRDAGVAAVAEPDSTDPETPGGEWPGFRGAARDGIVRGVRIETDWSARPPAELWRRPIGPGWSSFAVHGRLVYTQEQRGDEELVSAYDLETGAPVWRHRDAARFWESNAGAGPRGTPTLDRGRVYTLGATGLLNALDARTGAVVWSRHAAADTGRPVPDWGFSSSPLVVGDLVVVATAGVLAAYDRSTGRPRWTGPAGGSGYSSPHLATIDGVAQVVLLNGAGAIGVAPADGAVLWRHEWRGDGIVQPTVVARGDVLIGSGSGLAAAVGLRRISVAQGSSGWTVEERWTSRDLKPYFNDFVVHEGHAYGFDGRILACVDLETGTRKWKGGRYGHGQMVLLPDQALLLVLSEDGELALVRAAPDGFSELARVPAIEGKTWNHPVLAGDVVLVRNGEEMAAFRLATASR